MPKINKFKNKTQSFIETGSYMGDGIQLAIDSGFEKVYSIEISESHYKFLSELIESKGARALFEQITLTDFSAQAVNAFHKIITSGFDRNAILAANKNVNMRIIDFKIVLNLMVLECHESDIQNPAFLTFTENILQLFTDFISRSQNAEERKRLLRQEYGVDQTETQKPPMQGQQRDWRGRPQ